MSKIEDLLEKHCPKGVNYSSMGSLFNLRKGENLTNEKAVPGIYPVITASRGSNFTHQDFNFDGEFITISSHGAYAGHVSYFNQKFWLGNNVYLLEPLDKSVSVRFYLHVLKSLAHVLIGTVNTGGIPYINAKDLLRLSLPKPPIEVQLEIVSILDKFTQLEAELEAELEARKKQYAFYRESLFEDKTYDLKALDSVASIWRGRRFVKDDILEVGVPAIHYGEIYTKYGLAATQAYSFLEPTLASKLRFASPGDVVLVSAGETIEDIGKSFTWLGKQDVVIHDACYGIRSASVDSRYMVHFFNTHNFRSQLRKYISSSKISAISTEKLGKVFIPVPSIKVQLEIADALDAFDALVSDMSNGLPGEIKVRHQQFEYYRNRLLSFSKFDVA